MKECTNCGESENLHEHHIIPICKGGPNKRWNRVVLCRKCHLKVHRGELPLFINRFLIGYTEEGTSVFTCNGSSKNCERLYPGYIGVVGGKSFPLCLGEAPCGSH